jgi:hypothetical protein
MARPRPQCKTQYWKKNRLQKLDLARQTQEISFRQAKSKEVKTGCNLAESSKEGCGSKSKILPMMMMMD